MNRLPRLSLGLRTRGANPAPWARATGAALLLTTLAPALALAAAAGKYTLTGSEVEIHNLVGAVRITPGTGKDVVVQVTPGGDDAAQLTVETGAIDGVQMLRVIYPESKIVYPEMGRGSTTNLRVRDDGRLGGGKGWDGAKRVSLSGSGSGLEAHADLTIQVPAGKTLRLRIGAGDMDVNNVKTEMLDLDSSSGPITCNATQADLRLDTGSGEVRVSAAMGDVLIDTGSGDVDVSEATGKKVDIDTGSGRVALDQVKAEEVGVDTGSGDVTMTELDSPSVAVDTGSGSVRIEASNRLHDCDVDTGSGGVVVVVGNSFNAAFEIETGSGGIDIDVPHTLSRSEHGYVRGQIGNGQGSLAIDTGSGSVSIRRAGSSR
jgi:Putative adhesin